MADRLARYLDAGVKQLVLIPFGGRWRDQFTALAEARRLLLS
jgi:hypothetical protein